MVEQEQTASLACTENGSDKVYFAQLSQSTNGWLVTAQYGARGGTLKPADKHPTPVAYAIAERAFTKLVKSKLAKGYVPSGSQGATRMTAVPSTAELTNIRPQLLNAIERCEVRVYLSDASFVAQPKHDGERRLLVIEGCEVYGVNRKGQRVALLESLAAQAEQLPVGRDGRTVLDGEQVGDTLHVWDVLEVEGVDLRGQPLHVRQQSLRSLFEGLSDTSPLVLTETATTVDEKFALLDRMTAQGLEGVVFKRKASGYTPGRPASGGDWFKYKLVASATVRVQSHNPGKASVAVEVKDGDAWAFIGNVTIPANHAMPEVGAVVEVEYLYVANVGGCLFQPVYKGVRTDQDEGDCGIDQLKYRGVAKAA
ncbi:MAG: hypothetical protein BGP25_05270 [Lysobacterales bacterium 63-13]|nr:MAG: hypothetical protein BGP25_05270 [Xanthomonadales bacterium 63-13]